MVAGVKILPILVLAALWGCFSGCSFLPEREGPLEPEVPEQFDRLGGETPAPDRWWEEFGSVELNRLVTEALAGNFNLQAVAARLRQARAAAAIAGSGLYPDLNLQLEGGATRARTGSGESRATATSENYLISLAASYEIDLWGRVRSEAEAASSLAGAAAEDLAAARISLGAEVADRWLKAVELSARLELVGSQAGTNRDYLDLLRLRQRKGVSTALAVFQQEQILAGTEALLPRLESDLQTTLHELAVLLGRPPGSVPGLSETELPGLPPLPALGLPAELIGRRPDIQAAYLRLASSEYAVAAARANRLPALSLGGSLGYRSGDLGDLLQNWFAGFAAGILAPLLDGGRRGAEADRERAVLEERLAAYREVVLKALREVADALVREEKQEVYLSAVSRQHLAARSALAAGLVRYRKGESEYLDVLAALGSVQALERDYLIARRDLLLYRVGLLRALAGGWAGEENAKDGSDGEKDE